MMASNSVIWQINQEPADSLLLGVELLRAILVSHARKLLLQEEVGKGWNLILQGKDLNGTYKLCSYFSIPWPQSGIFQNKLFESISLWL